MMLPCFNLAAFWSGPHAVFSGEGAVPLSVLSSSPFFSSLSIVILNQFSYEERVLKTVVILFAAHLRQWQVLHRNGSLPGGKSTEWTCLYHLYTCPVFISSKWVCVFMVSYASVSTLIPPQRWNPLGFNVVGMWRKCCSALGLIYKLFCFLHPVFPCPLTPHAYGMGSLGSHELHQGGLQLYPQGRH